MARRPRKAEEVADAIAADLKDAPAGQWLPSWRELTTTHSVALGTVRNAINILVERGVVENLAGQGTRKLAPPARVVLRAENDQALEIEGERGFAVAVRAAGLEPWYETPGRQWVQAEPDAAQRLGVPTGSRAFKRSREHGWIEHGQHVHVMLSHTWYLAEIAEQIPVLQEPGTGPGGTTSRLIEAGYAVWWEVINSAKIADDAESEWLGIGRGSAVLDVWRRCFDQTGRILEVTQRVIDPAKHQITFSYGPGMPGQASD